MKRTLQSDGHRDDLETVRFIPRSTSEDAFGSDEEEVHWIATANNDKDSELGVSVYKGKYRPKAACTRGEKQLTCVVILCLLLIIALSSVLALGHNYVKQLQKVCQEPHCVEISAGLLRYMNLSADPCTDFYQFTCGKWNQEELIPPDKASWNFFSKVGLNNRLTLKRLLEEEEGDDEFQRSADSALRKARVYYNTCMNETAREGAGDKPLKELIKSLGYWSLIEGGFEPDRGEGNYNLAEKAVAFHKIGVSVLFTAALSVDDKNSSFRRIMVTQTGLGMEPDDYLGNNTQLQEAYLKLATELVVLLGADKMAARQKMQEVYDFETGLAKIMVPAKAFLDIEKVYNLMTIEKLNNLTLPHINMNKYLAQFFGEEISPTEEILVPVPSYLEKLGEYVSNTESRVLNSYMMWHTALAFVNHLSEPYRQAYFNYLKVTLGIQQRSALWEICVARTDDNFNLVTAHLYVKERFAQSSKNQVEDILRDLQQAFIENMPEVAWMDQQTKREAVLKAKGIKHKIGYPNNINNQMELDEKYKQLDVSSFSDFENALNINKFQFADMLSYRGKPVNKTKWESSSTAVNAFYNPSNNEIIFPAAILQPPFFNPKYPKAILYGTIGMVMGHELTHAFDNQGRLYDVEGNLYNWWKNESIQRFTQHTECMINQYSNYSVDGQHLDGELTLSENMADGGGLKTAHRAYKNWQKSGDHSEVLLPGLDLSSDQLFFLGLAHLWCSQVMPAYQLSELATNHHSPDSIRVIGMMSNSEEFSKAYSCPDTSPMNKQHKCVIW